MSNDPTPLDAREAAWQAWLDANPNKPICTHWREAFLAGYDAPQAALAAAREQGIREGIEAAVSRISEWGVTVHGAEGWMYNEQLERLIKNQIVLLRGFVAAIDPASISAQGTRSAG